MSLTPQETLEFFSEEIAGAANGLEIARASRNVHLAVLNLQEMFKGHLFRGLIKWKLGEVPVRDLENAVRLIPEGIAIVQALDASLDIEKAMPLSRAALLAALVDLPLDFRRPTGITRAADVRLDDFLAAAHPASYAEEVSALIGELRRGKKTVLAAETYENYFQILSSRNDQTQLQELADKGANLFKKRARDSFYSGAEQTEGGGPDNPLVVDYRLAVALKKAGFTGSSAHAWRW